MGDSLRILYVDDDEDIRTVATLSLAVDPGIVVQTAASAPEALTLLQTADPVPDLILLDVMMPGMDGPELARRIRAMPGLGGLPLIFLTARAQRRDIDGYLALGAATVISKPFDPMTLASIVRRALAGAPGDPDR